MKYFLLLIVAYFLPLSSYSETDDLNLGKQELKKEFGKGDFKVAIKYLESAVAKEPNNSEAHYFLGYAYDRSNSEDGFSMDLTKLELAIKSSYEFETVVKLTPKYTGELLMLDPYSKITSIWGSQAFAYLNSNKIDSAKWALSEGKKRGGFRDFLLEFNKQILSNCSQNSYIISSGDNLTFPILYLQLINGFRTDVNLINISLLNTLWYPRYLYNNKIIDLNIPISKLDLIEIRNWKDTTITINLDKSVKSFTNKFKWIVKPNINNEYLLRSGLIFLNFLQTNKFKRDIFFTTSFNPIDQLNLNNHLERFFLIDKISLSKITQNANNLIKGINGFDLNKLDSKSIINSTDELLLIDILRYDYCETIRRLLIDKNTVLAKDVYNKLINFLPENLYPYNSPELKEYIKNLYLNQ
ncbi:MAG: hypothetical protein IPP08_09915 [Chlorobiota bacterium]|nr:hypothetical protein [Chlorobiota bacterium]QQS66076.1 MAG: hypothetical protein IPP08_09915 [Chlorobiota bacterium]